MEEKSGLYIKPVEMGIVDNSLVMKIKTDRQKLKPEDFRCYVYADDYFLMCTGAGDNLPTFRRGTISLNMKSRYLWLPGTYKFIFALSSVFMGMMEFRLDDEQQIEFLGMKPIEIFSPEDIASSFFGGDVEWELLTTMPGTQQLRHEAIEEVRRRHWSVMISMNVEDYAKQPSGYIFTCCGNDSPAPPIRCFHRQLNAKGNIEVVDCNTLYDSALQNPLDGFNHLINDTERGTTICLDKVGALMGAGGRVIVTQLSQAALDRKYTLWLCGTRQELDALFNVYPSLWRLFPETKRLTILAPTPQEMMQNFFRQLNAWDLKPTEQVFHQLAHTIQKGYEDRTLANWSTRDINRFLQEHVMPRYLQRLVDNPSDFRKDELRPEDIDFSKLMGHATDYTEALNELNQMVGLDNIKQAIASAAHRVKIFSERRQMGLTTTDKDIYHAIFTGSPGTGKTTVAKKLGKIYHDLGVLSKGEVIAVDRSRIVGRFIGDTEDNVKKLLEEARGNVLFVDEAYSLYGSDNSNDYGRRAVECLLAALTEKNSDMLVIFAGYKEEMDRLMTMNPGLKGRFPYEYHFADYTAEQLMQIAEHLFEKDEYLLTPDARRELQTTIDQTLRQPPAHFGNARWVEQYVRNGILPALADRLVESKAARALTREDYQRVEASDIRAAYRLFKPETIELKPRLRVLGFSA